MDKISIQELNKLFAERTKLPEDEVERLVKAMFNIISEELAGNNPVKVRGLGTFKIVDVDSRESVNVNTGERFLIEGHGKVSFIPDNTMKEIVNRPFSQFETVVLNDGVDFTASEAGDTLPEPKTDVVNDDSLEETDDAEAAVEPVEEILEPAEDTKETEVLVSEALSSDMSVDGGSHNDSTEETAVDERPESVEERQEMEEVVWSADTTPADEQHTVETDSTMDDDKEAVPAAEVYEPMRGDEPAAALVRPVAVGDDGPTNSSEEPVDEPSVVVGKKDGGRGADMLLWTLLWVVVVAVSLFLGYLYGSNEDSINKTVALWLGCNTEAMVTVKRPLPARKPVPIVRQDTDSVKTSSSAVDETTRSMDTEKAEPLNYEARDVRVRTGAYRIVGTKSELTLKQDQSLKSLSDLTLGPGMECYIEVYNNLPEGTLLKKGQVVRIPKLELKKKGKAN